MSVHLFGLLVFWLPVVSSGTVRMGVHVITIRDDISGDLTRQVTGRGKKGDVLPVGRHRGGPHTSGADPWVLGYLTYLSPRGPGTYSIILTGRVYKHGNI